jgi:outer membrane autotransporter protein
MSRSFLVVFVVMLLISPNIIRSTMADDSKFNAAFRENLRTVCGNGLFQAGNNLRQTCRDIGGGGGPVGRVGASPTNPNGLGSLQQRLQPILESKEEKAEYRYRTAYTLNTTDQFVQGAALQLPPAGGASPEIVYGLGSGASGFLSAGAYAINHHNNSFEDGYEAQLPTVTVGADYRINDWLLAGLALNYTNYDGTYDDGGGFDKNIFGPLLYATFLPFEGAFANIVLGYARQENENNRLARASNPDETLSFRGHTSADYSENQYTAGILAGYDQPFGNVTIGPRLGLAFSYEDFGSVKEEGDTGLELRYNNLNQTSVQSSLGVQASVGFETAYGIVVPQATVAWVHEYANSDRNINARLVEASPDAPSFTFQRERPARDWASIGLGASALLPNGLQPFVQFATIQGNENFVSYGGTAGVRLGL